MPGKRGGLAVTELRKRWDSSKSRNGGGLLEKCEIHCENLALDLRIWTVNPLDPSLNGSEDDLGVD